MYRRVTANKVRAPALGEELLAVECADEHRKLKLRSMRFPSYTSALVASLLHELFLLFLNH